MGDEVRARRLQNRTSVWLECKVRPAISTVGPRWEQAGPASLTAAGHPSRGDRPDQSLSVLQHSASDLQELSRWRGAHQHEGEKRCNLLRLNSEATEIIPKKLWLKLEDLSYVHLWVEERPVLLNRLKSKMRVLRNWLLFFVLLNYGMSYQPYCIFNNSVIQQVFNGHTLYTMVIHCILVVLLTLLDDVSKPYLTLSL